MNDRLFPEIKEALRDALDASEQDDQFGRQFVRLIANAYQNNSDRGDVERLLQVLRLDISNGH